jgi:hypothetical protein
MHLKAEQIGAEQRLEELLPCGQAPPQQLLGPRDVQEPPDPHAGLRGSQQARHEHQMVVVDKDLVPRHVRCKHFGCVRVVGLAHETRDRDRCQ